MRTGLNELRNLMGSREWTFEELAERLGVSTNDIRRKLDFKIRQGLVKTSNVKGVPTCFWVE